MDHNGESGDGCTGLPDISREEELHIRTVMRSFVMYKNFINARCAKSRSDYEKLPEEDKYLCPTFYAGLDQTLGCVEHNQNVLNAMIGSARGQLYNDTLKDNGEIKVKVKYSDIDKVKTCLKQIVRDWSDLGKKERLACYQPVIDIVESLFPPEKRSEVDILVPGAGLGRLAWEFAKRGFNTEGNEFSLHMITVSFFILNECQNSLQYSVYPYVHQFCNALSSEDRFSAVSFPDTCTASLPKNISFSMSSGDFLESYTENDRWDVVATVYFLDTAHNVMAYIRKIWDILKPGGVWVNFGPLLYHYSDMPNEVSIELNYQQLMEAIKRKGFIIKKDEIGIPSQYTQNPLSMLQYYYNCNLFYAEKPT